MEIIGVFIPSDRAHIRIQPFAMDKTVFGKRQSFPFCQRMNDLGHRLILLPDPESYRPFHAVQIIVQSGFRSHKQRCGHSGQVQFFCKRPFKIVLDVLDRYFRFLDIHRAFIAFGDRNTFVFHHSLLYCSDVASSRYCRICNGTYLYMTRFSSSSFTGFAR